MGARPALAVAILSPMMALADQLVAVGLQKTDADPDLHVVYHGEATQEVIVDRVGYYDDWYWGFGASTTRVRTHDRGTIIIDLVDAENTRLVFRGVASDLMSESPDRNVDRVRRGVERVFRRYPTSE